MAVNADALSERLQQAVVLLRVGQEGAGGEAMADFTDQLWAALSSGAFIIAPHLLEAILPQVIAAQQRGDWLWVADLLEYELGPLLDNSTVL